MKKKEANPYKKSKNVSEPPYLTPHELQQFQSLFNLFDKKIESKKLKETFIDFKNESSCRKPVEEFISNLQHRNPSLTFDEYKNQMVSYLSKQNEADLIVKVLGEQKNFQIPIELIKQIIEEVIGRDLMAKELNEIMEKIFDEELGQCESIQPAKIKQLILRSKQT